MTTATAAPDREAVARAAAAPPPPRSIAETGIPESAVVDLLLKTLHVQSAQQGQQLAEALGLPFPIVDDLLLTLQQRRLLEVRGVVGHGRGGYTFELTVAGRDRAREAMEVNHYVGPLPVPLAVYGEWLARQSLRHLSVTRDRIAAGFDNMILDPSVFEVLGPAINSARSLFLYGDSGNGKTMIAEAIARLLGGVVYVPYAVDIGGHVMVVHDPVYHGPPEEEAAEGRQDRIWRGDRREYDRRFARVRRPVVLVGGELTLEQLDLQYDPLTKMYQAPFQVKANGGVLIIDDFGRQRVRPRDLLNRWVVPLEKHHDFLSLLTGAKFPVPFDCLLILATNLEPAELADEAFLRRIHYKIRVAGPSRAEFTRIFQQVCHQRGVPFEERAVEYVYSECYGRAGHAPRACHPRDIIDHLCDAARFEQVEPRLTPHLLERACRSYFVQLGSSGHPGTSPGRQFRGVDDE
jgi:predicted ATPase with chaperone activity